MTNDPHTHTHTHTQHKSNQVRIVPQSQAQPKRAEIMRKVANEAFKSKIRALEMGVWYGVGSTNIWLDALPENSEIVLIDSWRPYASKADIEGTEFRPAHWDYAKMDSLTSEAFLSTFLNVRRFENEVDNKKISLIRSQSSFTSLLKDSSFDFIYIDADHKYESVKRDIIEAKRLAKKDFSIICGDDLEKFPTKELIEIAKQHTDRDYLKGEYGFHPGVCLAISEEFVEVNMIDGFWWIAYIDGNLTTEFLKPTQSQP